MLRHAIRPHVVDAIRNLVGDEELFAGNTGLLNRNANFFLSAIHFCTVQVIEALLDCSFGQCNKLRVKVRVADFLEPGCSGTKRELYTIVSPMISRDRIFP